jgi:hypothetical protein
VPVRRLRNQNRRTRRSAQLRWVSEKAQKLLREQLANAPKRAEPIERRADCGRAQAAAIPERPLIAVASALEVRTQRGRWWLPGQGLSPHLRHVAKKRA